MLRYRPKRQTVLIGEDNLGDISLLRQIFKEIKFKGDVQTFKIGPQIRDYLLCEGEFAEHDISRPPGLVLLDINIPKLSGIKVLEQVKRNPATCRIPIIMMSSGPHPADVREAYRLGCAGFLMKPYDFDDFRNIIDLSLQFWLQDLEDFS